MEKTIHRGQGGFIPESQAGFNIHKSISVIPTTSTKAKTETI